MISPLSIGHQKSGFRWVIKPNDGFLLLSRKDTFSIKVAFKKEGNYTIMVKTDNAFNGPAIDSIRIKAVASPRLLLSRQQDACFSFIYKPKPVISGAIYKLNGIDFDPNIGITVKEFGKHSVIAFFENQCGLQTVTDTFSIVKCK